jgi:hypothetical protein
MRILLRRPAVMAMSMQRQPKFLGQTESKNNVSCDFTMHLNIKLKLVEGKGALKCCG